MKKIQVSLPDPTLKEIDTLKKEMGFESESECGRHIIQEWITLRRHGVIKSSAPAVSLTEMATLFSGNLRSQLAEA